MTEKKPVEYHLMQVGEVLGPVVIDIDDHFVKVAAFTGDDYHQWHLGSASPFGGPVAQSGALLCDLMRLLYTRYDPDRDHGLHQHEEFTLFSPVFVGERVRLSGRIVDKYVKRQRGHVVIEAEARTIADDRLIIHHRATETMALRAGLGLPDTIRPAASRTRRVNTTFPEGRTVLNVLSRRTVVGDPLCGPVKTIRQDQISVYSGAHLFWRGIHTDRQFALESGMKDTVAQGLMMTCHVAEWAARLFGAAWYSGGQASMTYLAPVYPNDNLSFFGVVSELEETADGVTAEIEFWVRTQNDAIAAIGWFRGLLPRPEPGQQ